MFALSLILLALLQAAFVFGSPVVDKGLVAGSKAPPPICNIQHFAAGNVFEYTRVINHFQAISSISAILLKPGCYRLACSGSSELVACNDNQNAVVIQLKSFAEYGNDIISRCQFDGVVQGQTGIIVKRAVGQEFDTDRWNVILKGIAGSDPKCTDSLSKIGTSADDDALIITLPGEAPVVASSEDQANVDSRKEVRDISTDLAVANITTTSNQILPPLCNVQNFPYANTLEVRVIQNDLSKMNVRFAVPGRSTGPTYCLRIGCRGESEMVVCNDNNYAIQPHAKYLATYADGILDRCKVPDGPFYRVNGQEFDTDNYNVIVRGVLKSDPKCHAA